MKKILVRAPQWLGDAVVSTIFLTRLKERSAEAEIDVLAIPSLKPLYAPHPSVHAVIDLPYTEGGNIFKTAQNIRSRGYDEAYILPRSFRTALEIWLARVPRRIGYAGDIRRLLLTDVFPYSEKHFYAHRYLRLIGEEHLPLEGLRPFFPKAELNEEEASQILGITFSRLKKPFLGIAPASVAPARTWEPHRFAEVAQQFLKEKGGTVFLFGSPNETEVTAQIVSKVEGAVVDTAGKLDLPQLGWCLSRLDIFLANDSGLMHAASAFDVPSVILFGPSDPAWALPQTGRFRALQHKEIWCVPCLRNECVRFGADYKACMSALQPSQVLSVLKEICV